MNKARRHELKMLKYKKRLRNYRIKPSEITVRSNFYAFRSHGKPCSCIFCSPGKILANGGKKRERQEILFQIENAA